MTADDLVVEALKLKDHVAAQTKAFNEYCAKYKSRIEEIENQLLAMLNEQKIESVRTDHGTAYKSTLLNVSVSPDGEDYNGARGREAVLDFALEHWDAIGNDLLLVSVQKDAVKRYLEEHGKPPPGVQTSWFTRVNIRRS